MTTIILWTVVGAFIGWNVPQPRYAKAIQRWVTGKSKTPTGKPKTLTGKPKTLTGKLHR